MSVCEKCWTEAGLAALAGGASQSERYNALVKQRPTCPHEPMAPRSEPVTFEQAVCLTSERVSERAVGPLVPPSAQTAQPIETAPEATYVLAFLPNYGWVRATMTRDHARPVWWGRIAGDGEIIYPTHWMSDPPTPNSAPQPSSDRETMEPTDAQMRCGRALYGPEAACTCGTCPTDAAPPERPSDIRKTVGENVVTVTKEGIYVSTPFSELRENMSPEAQARAKERTAELLRDIERPSLPQTPWTVMVAEWLYSTERERRPNAWLLLDAKGQPIDLRYSLETLERIVSAVNSAKISEAE